uniref:Isocitrate dehydrogenase [NAD] subunit, mitochondrial n=1 Tax=Panagrolaimus sp. JU765 TaxID=591449 RepID=A0AC34RIS7_9BILA
MLFKGFLSGLSSATRVCQLRSLATASNAAVPELAEKLKVTVIPGDGVGPELIYSVQEIIKATGIPLVFDEVFLSQVHFNRSATIDDVIRSMKANNHVALKGVIQEGFIDAGADEPGINMQLRKKLDLFANVVHIQTHEGIKTRHGKKLDFVIIREQTEGEYSSLEHELVPGVIECLKIMTKAKCERIAKFAFDYATKHNRRKVTAVHKANIMKLGDGLFLRTCEKMSRLYPKIEFENMIVDNTAMQLVSRPERFDVMVMPNLYGNIVDNLAAGLVGGAGIVPGQSVGSDFTVFEPGSRHAFSEGLGRNIANPTAMILCCANMLNHLHLEKYGIALRQAVEKVLRDGRKMSRLYPKIEFENMIVDNTAMQLVSRPERFDVMVMPNLYGNIVDNLAAGLVGGAGIVPGQSVGSDFTVFEPGSRHAFSEGLGRNIANPTAMILCCANMLNHLHLEKYGIALRQAVEKVLRDGRVKTRDLGGYATTREFSFAVINNFKLD